MSVASAVGDRTYSEIQRLCRTGLSPEALAPRVAERLGRAVPFDGYALVTLDPLSGLATAFHFSDTMGSAEDARFFLENIYFEDDVLDYGWMARNRIAAMTLSEATGGEPKRALRYREYNAPKGFGPGVRAVLTVRGKPWGGLCLVRGKDVGDFTPDRGLVWPVTCASRQTFRFIHADSVTARPKLRPPGGTFRCYPREGGGADLYGPRAPG
jgi:hypothetical protein